MACFIKNKGNRTLPISQIKKLRLSLLEQIRSTYPNLKVTIGKYHPGWSKRSAIQYHVHAGRHDNAVQLEISHLLRDTEQNINNIVNIISQSLKQTFH